jgi:subtilisin family serine protease
LVKKGIIMNKQQYLILLVALWFGGQSVLAADLLSENLANPERRLSDLDTNTELARLAEKASHEGSVRVIAVFDQGLDAEAVENTESLSAQSSQIRQQQEALLKEVPIRRIKSIKFFTSFPFLAMTVDINELQRLRASPQVVQLVEDRINVLSRHELAIAQIGADVGWAMGHTGAGQSIAILDNGIDKNHPFLLNKVVGEACFSTRDPARRLVPLCSGRRTKQFGLNSAAVNCAFGDYQCTHGTFMAGIAAGNSLAPDLAGSGVAPHANIIAIKVASLITNRRICAPAGRCQVVLDSDALRGLDLVFRWRGFFSIAAVNISAGAVVPPRACLRTPIRRAVARLRAANIATIAASGNNGFVNRLTIPACIPGVVSVGAVDFLDQVWPLSNSATSLSLLAPGVNIGFPMPSVVPPGYELAGTGTSFAVPYVTGAWAVLKARKPSASVDEIWAILAGSGKPVMDPKNGLVRSRIQINQAHAAF